MTETRDQWIEREARAARERYVGADNWDGQSETHKQDWRSVVAPFYQELVADADTIRDLREIAIKAYLAHPHAKDAGCMVDPMEAAIVAVLRGAKPEVVMGREDIYNIVFILDHLGVDVADSTKLALASINSHIRYRFELPQPEPVRVQVDVDGLADAIRCAQGHFWNWKNISEDSQEGWRRSARAALAFLNIEPCAKPADVALTPNERNELENLRAECKRLRNYAHGLEHDNKNLRQDLDALKVPSENIRFAVNAYEVLEECGGDTNINDLESYMEYLAKQIIFPLVADKPSRPVKVRFDVSAGVPSVEELAKQICLIPDKHGNMPQSWLSRPKYEKEFLIRGAAAIRDRILAGIQRREWTEQDVEELARVIYESPDADGDTWKWDDVDEYAKNTTRADARAALAWFDGKRGGV